ncbi:acetyltransferase [Eremomyces bilateralis CBS 781.70]|uniref:Acetyltransferase n=1 Tax=Eremomyces bilateralis CBS 781.70 TaxID=1392243 RepID=A0A6G1GCR3_9PEZI|nr:acetyltransferase [Eremomyces bilateralis CBS 781.70]KAF1815885.1 acetyltransferase [Eremomyces bilateralis CBS 781.70]
MASDSVILVTPRTILRPMKLSDILSVSRAANSAAVAQYMRNRFPSPYTEADAEKWIKGLLAKERPCGFAIADPKTDEVIGGIGIELGKDVDFRSAEFGYWLGEDYWGKGIMSEVGKAFAEWVLKNIRVTSEYEAGKEFTLTRLFASVLDGNDGSRRVLEKSGFVLEGIMKRGAYKHGKVMDQWIYAITQED